MIPQNTEFDVSVSFLFSALYITRSKLYPGIVFCLLSGNFHYDQFRDSIHVFSFREPML